MDSKQRRLRGNRSYAVGLSLPLRLAVFGLLALGATLSGERALSGERPSSPVPSAARHVALPKVARPRARHRFAVQTIPIYLCATPDTVDGGNGTITCTLTVDRQTGDTGLVQVGCDQPGALVSPGGSWPYLLLLPSGETTVTFTIATNSVQADTPVTIYACTSNADAGDPDSWSAQTTVTVH
jgi:hypothetical protein